ncbi:hypothetical protein AAFF_G00137390 [Aldrovandia affinis]|uniref:Uncharacterized protein n=1 Tax=Aldrovandia affinis TaxID=143900 RepID=A0AAD7TBW0_9TELE|nr:hypothetical protein AAFF_G00137390 [Aldrovandia affinis]
MDSNGIKAIIFDLDNTLIDTSGSDKIAIEKVKVLLGTRFGQDDVRKICDGFKQKLLHESYDRLGAASIDDKTRLELFAIPGPVRQLLEDLRVAHKLLLLTNGVAQTQREKIEAVRCEGLFHAMVVGGEHAEEKPAPPSSATASVCWGWGRRTA